MASRTGEENARYMREYRLRMGGMSLVVPGGGVYPDLKTHKTVESSVLAEVHMIPGVAKFPG
jgi:hypothetical protein